MKFFKIKKIFHLRHNLSCDKIRVMKKTNFYKQEIKKLLACLKSYQPEKIILFGSATAGRLSRGSDLDVLIIKKTKEPFWQRQKKIAQLLKTDVSVDAFVLTPKEIKKALKEIQPFIYDIIHQGKVIYEKTS